jgi:putative component of toxin-antitoxin plasmid stabilization module
LANPGSLEGKAVVRSKTPVQKAPKETLEIDSKFTKKAKLICMMCGGKSCAHEDWKTIKNPALQGLNSNWINNDIVASQRLSNRLIKEFDLMAQFKEKNIGAVINLQEPGEHANCGDGIQDMRIGFSYDYEILLKSK